MGHRHRNTIRDFHSDNIQLDVLPSRTQQSVNSTSSSFGSYDLYCFNFRCVRRVQAGRGTLSFHITAAADVQSGSLVQKLASNNFPINNVSLIPSSLVINRITGKRSVVPIVMLWVRIHQTVCRLQCVGTVCVRLESPQHVRWTAHSIR